MDFIKSLRFYSIVFSILTIALAPPVLSSVNFKAEVDIFDFIQSVKKT